MNSELKAEALAAVNACGTCDGGLPMSCTCIAEPRLLIGKLLAALEVADIALDRIAERLDGGGGYENSSSAIESVEDAVRETGRTIEYGDV